MGKVEETIPFTAVSVDIVPLFLDCLPVSVLTEFGQ
jgi:hypothetical protein